MLYSFNKALFVVEHALDCHVGGLVSLCHSEVWDAIGDLSSLVWKQVQKEPIVCESTIDDSISETLIADLRVRGVWELQVDAIFDVRVVDTDAPSYCSHSPQAVLWSAEVEKKGSILYSSLSSTPC